MPLEYLCGWVCSSLLIFLFYHRVIFSSCGWRKWEGRHGIETYCIATYSATILSPHSQGHLHLHFLNEEAEDQKAKEVAGIYKPMSLSPCLCLGSFLYTVLAQHEG